MQNAAKNMTIDDLIAMDIDIDAMDSKYEALDAKVDHLVQSIGVQAAYTRLMEAPIKISAKDAKAYCKAFFKHTSNGNVPSMFSAAA